MTHTGLRSPREAGVALGALLLCLAFLAFWTQEVYTPYGSYYNAKEILHNNPCDLHHLYEGQQKDAIWSLIQTAGAHTVPQNVTKKVAIIGAAGFIGSRLHEYLNLSAAGWLVHGYDRDPRELASRVRRLAALDIPDSTLAQYE